LLSDVDFSGISSLEEDSETAATLGEILACLAETSKIVTIGTTPAPAETGEHIVRVILTGSKGLNLRSNNDEFIVRASSNAHIIIG
jgi:hypothetical protein